MRLWVGFDVGKAFHWVCVLDDEGEVLLSRRVEAEERDIETCCEEIAALGRSDERLVATDLLGGPATLLEAVLLGRGERLFHLPGIAVNRARDGYRGESKSDARDARVIADQIRMRWRSLQEVRPREDAAAELRTLVAHRRSLVEDQARVITRLRALLLEVFPGLEAALDLSTDRALLATTRVATPSAARRLGASRLARWLKDRGIRRSEELAGKVVEAAKVQRRELPAAETKAALVSEMAAEVLRTRGRVATVDTRLEELMAAKPEAAVVRSMPGMGPLFTAEFLSEVGDSSRFASADALAAAAGLVPATRQSGDGSFQRRARRGNRRLKNLLYRSAFSCTVHHAPSRIYYLRKRAEGKAHHRAVIALARRRVNVLWAMLRDGELYRDPVAEAA
ncbi:MAG: IS110 family transposase [Rubrobacter sp.]|jgi:transposase|nr:IS110 family transposase [Rubrobacter sp.]MBA3790345.1 IS110 family transposase [Rubrobacter sp.]MDQ3639618.1 IS110 family transposase [Actinomycetota bacterium]